jgi:excisionase family DNA binding protein
MTGEEYLLSEEMEGYITVHKAAQALGRSTEQVRRYLREGKLPGRRVGGQWFIREQAVLYRASGAEEIAVTARYSGHPRELGVVVPEERLRLFDRITRRREEIRVRWEESGISVDAAELLREMREEER